MEGLKIQEGANSNVADIMCPLVGLGLPDLPKTPPKFQQSCNPISIKGTDSACYLPPGFSYLSTALGKVGKYRFIDFPKPQMVLQVQSELVGSIRSANVDLRLKKPSAYDCCIIKL